VSCLRASAPRGWCRAAMQAIGPLVAILVVAGLAACSYPIRNQEAANLDPRSGYRWSALDGNELEDTVLIVTASGGGTRATALALATLRALDHARLPSGRSLADEVDVISSVSGGSVAAGYFALTGTAGFDALESDFIRKDGIATMAWRGANPIGLIELATPARERIDLLIDYLDETLFHEATYDSLIRRGKRPYLILNAGDMVSGTIFPFTKSYFDLLCSDLTSVKLSVAVAASAAFPAALSPVTLKNYSPCPAQQTGAWPPGWVETAMDTPWYDNPSRVRRGRVGDAYAEGTRVPPPYGKAYLHLLDGGVADNLGIGEPFRLLTTADVSPDFLNRIAHGRIKRIVFVLVNARADPPSRLNDRIATPGAADMLLGTISAAMDNATFANIERLRVLLEERFKAAAHGLPPEVAANFANVETYFVPVDFGAIDDTDCRRGFESIATSWTLPADQIDALLEVGPALVGQAPDFARVLAAVGAELDAPLPALEVACAARIAGRAGE
jgi:NTE family protein